MDQKENPHTINYISEDSEPYSLEEMADRIAWLFKWENDFLTELHKPEKDSPRQADVLKVG